MPRRRFRGVLSFEELSQGCEAAISNARRLYNDAILLAEYERWPSALASLLLAGQEIGKATLLNAMARVHPKAQHQLRRWWSAYYSHPHKAWRARTSEKQWDSLFEIMLGAQALIKAGPEDEKLRQAALYINYDSKEGWSAPSNIERSLVEERILVVEAALLRMEFAQAQGAFTLRSMEIQQQVYGKMTLMTEDQAVWTDQNVLSIIYALSHLHFEYFARMMAEGFFSDLSDDEQILGVSVKDVRAYTKA